MQTTTRRARWLGQARWGLFAKHPDQDARTCGVMASAPSHATRQWHPRDLDAQLTDLERWAKGALSQVDARNDAIKFWLLKAPPIVGSACAGIVGHFGWATRAFSSPRWLRLAY